MLEKFDTRRIERGSKTPPIRFAVTTIGIDTQSRTARGSNLNRRDAGKIAAYGIADLNLECAKSLIQQVLDLVFNPGQFSA